MFNPDTKVLDMAKLRPTDLRDAPRLYLPKPRPQREECLIQAKRQMYITATKEYIKSNCDSKGNQLEGNLQENLLKGIDEIQEFKKNIKL